MSRIAISFVSSLMIVFLLFFIMQKIVFGDKIKRAEVVKFDMVDFINLKKEPKNQEKKRQKQIKKQKTMPKKVQLSQKISQQNIKIKMPKMNLRLDLKKSNDLNDMQLMQSANGRYLTDIVPVFAIPPSYPRRARQRNIQGYVIVHFTINKQGDVTQIKIVKSHPEGYFENSARDAISKWKFNPKIQNGKPVEQLAEQKLEFRLR